MALGITLCVQQENKVLFPYNNSFLQFWFSSWSINKHSKKNLANIQPSWPNAYCLITHKYIDTPQHLPGSSIGSSWNTIIVISRFLLLFVFSQKWCLNCKQYKIDENIYKCKLSFIFSGMAILLPSIFDMKAHFGYNQDQYLPFLVKSKR